MSTLRDMTTARLQADAQAAFDPATKGRLRATVSEVPSAGVDTLAATQHRSWLNLHRKAVAKAVPR